MKFKARLPHADAEDMRASSPAKPPKGRSPSWADQALLIASDPIHKAKYRALQSWYRESVLSAPAGLDARGRRRVGSMLSADAVAADPSLNFIDDAAARYVELRIPDVREQEGALEETRLRHNMLSSQPLCFNIFGSLRGKPSFKLLMEV